MVADPGGSMVRKIAYWSTTTIASVMLLMSLTYLTGSEQVVSGFAKEGYPQHLRIVLGLANPDDAIGLMLTGSCSWAQSSNRTDSATYERENDLICCLYRF